MTTVAEPSSLEYCYVTPTSIQRQQCSINSAEGSQNEMVTSQQSSHPYYNVETASIPQTQHDSSYQSLQPNNDLNTSQFYEPLREETV